MFWYSFKCLTLPFGNQLWLSILVMYTYRMLNEDWFTTGGEDGSLALWFAMKKKPAVLVPAAHGYSAAGVPRWISAVGCLKQSDLVVSGSNDGAIRLWRADVEARSLEQVSLLRRDCAWPCVAFRRRRLTTAAFLSFYVWEGVQP